MSRSVPWILGVTLVVVVVMAYMHWVDTEKYTYNLYDTYIDRIVHVWDLKTGKTYSNSEKDVLALTPGNTLLGPFAAMTIYVRKKHTYHVVVSPEDIREALRTLKKPNQVPAHQRQQLVLLRYIFKKATGSGSKYHVWQTSTRCYVDGQWLC